MSSVLIESAQKYHALGNVSVFFGAWLAWIVIGALLLFVLLRVRERDGLVHRAWLVGLALVSGLLARLFFVEIIRLFYMKERPFVTLNIEPYISHAATNSFPSGHSAFFFALGAYLLLKKEKLLGWFMTVAALLIGIGRVLAGIHWVSDIVAGWAVGLVAALLVWYVESKIRRS